MRLGKPICAVPSRMIGGRGVRRHAADLTAPRPVRELLAPCSQGGNMFPQSKDPGSHARPSACRRLYLGGGGTLQFIGLETFPSASAA